MNGEAIISVSAAVVALVSLIKWAGVSERFGPVAVLLLAAVGCGIWGFSSGDVTKGTFFSYFAAWIAVATSAAGVYGFTRASGDQLTRFQTKKIIPLVLLAVILPLAMSGCGHGPSPKTDPIGAVAYNADQVAVLMGRVEKTVMNAEATEPPLVSTTTARTILKACRVVEEKNGDLADALEKLEKVPLEDLTARKPLLTRISVALDAMNIAIFDIVKPIQDDALREVVTGFLRQVARFLLAISTPGLTPGVYEHLQATYDELAA